MYQTIYAGFEIYEEKKEQTVYIITRLRGQTSAIEPVKSCMECALSKDSKNEALTGSSMEQTLI